MKKFSDFARAEPLDGDKIKIQEVLGKEIKVLDYKIAAVSSQVMATESD